MSKFGAIFRREVAAYFATPVAYVFGVRFLFLTGIFTFYMGELYGRGQADLDPRGFVRTGRDAGGGSTFETSTPGVFAVGDVRAGSVKRVASSVGEGSVVISAVWDHVARMADKAILAE